MPYVSKETLRVLCRAAAHCDPDDWKGDIEDVNAAMIEGQSLLQTEEDREPHWFNDVAENIRTVYLLPRDTPEQAVERFKAFCVMVTQFDAPLERLYSEVHDNGPEEGEAEADNGPATEA